MTSHTPVGRENTTGARRSSPLQRVRSYLSDELVSRFELTGRFRAPSTASPEQRSPSNFVRRLVASLERRGKDSSPIGRALAASFQPPGSPGVGLGVFDKRNSWRRSGCGVDGEAARIELCGNGAERLTSLRSKLENVYEESSTPQSAASSICGSSDDEELIQPDSTTTRTKKPTNSTRFTTTTTTNNNSSTTTSIPIIATTTRILKNFLSSIVSWRNSTSSTSPKSSKTTKNNNRLNRLLQLPRGNRSPNKINSKDNNDTDFGGVSRPSLGDELHVFRRDTMPRLMSRYERRRRPGAKNFSSSPDLMRLQRQRGTGVGGDRFESSFDRLLMRSRTSAMIHEDMGDGCVATVKPRRRSKCDLGSVKQQKRFSLDLDGVRVSEDNWDEDVRRWQEGSVTSLTATRALQPVQAPIAPNPPPLPPTASRKTKRDATNNSREPVAYAEVGQSFGGRSKGPKEDDPLYDVPRRLVPPPPAYHTVQLRLGQAPPRYENVGLGAGINSEIVETDDQRLQCTAFTTF